MVKMALVCTILLLADNPIFEIKTERATTKERSKILAPITSPKESSGTLLTAEIIPIKRLGKEVATAIMKKPTTNSFQPKNLAIFNKAPTNQLLDTASRK